MSRDVWNTRDQIVRAALELLDAEGYDALTMRRLADKLGIKAASLYNHVRDKEELLGLLADAICAEIPDADESRPWREQAESMARAVRRVLMSHRDAARVLAATPPAGPNRLRLMEQLLRTMVRAGFPKAKVADVAFLMSSFVIGFVLDETLDQPVDAAATKARRDEAKRWFKALPKEQFPTLVSLADALIDSPGDRRFELGMRALLDGFEAALLAKPARRRR